MARLVKSAKILDRSVMLCGPRDASSHDSSAGSESPAVSEALRQLPVPAGAIEAVARQIEAQASEPGPAELQLSFDQKLAEVEEQARERGFAEGQAAAAHKLELEWKARLERMESLLEALEQARRACEEAVEETAVAVAFESVAKIVGRKSVSMEIVREMIASVRQDASESGPIVVRVGSDDYEALVGEPFIIELEEDRGRIRLVEDPRVAFGGCIIETARGSIDARSEMQLDRLQKILVEARRSEES